MVSIRETPLDRRTLMQRYIDAVEYSRRHLEAPLSSQKREFYLLWLQIDESANSGLKMPAPTGGEQLIPLKDG